MRTVRFAEFIAEADHYRELAQVETVIVTGDDGAPQFVVMPHEVYRQLRKRNRQALEVSDLTDDELRGIGDAATLDQYDWPEDNDCAHAAPDDASGAKRAP